MAGVAKLIPWRFMKLPYGSDHRKRIRDVSFARGSSPVSIASKQVVVSFALRARAGIASTFERGHEFSVKPRNSPQLLLDLQLFAAHAL